MVPLGFAFPRSTYAFVHATIALLSTTQAPGMLYVERGQRDQALATNGTGEAAASLVRVEIFYESLCPSCHKLLLESLKPMWEHEELRSRLDLQFFPAGNVVTIPTADVSEGYRFWHPELEEEGADKYIFVCQHGERECLGNAIQACAMKLLSGPSEYLPLLFCMAEAAGSGSMVEKASFECMESLGISPTQIAQCVRDPSTNQMMFDIASHSNNLVPQREYTPWVLIAGGHSKAADEGNLLGPICASLGEPWPAVCVEAAHAQGSSGVWGSVRGWLGVAQTSAEVKDVRSVGSSHKLDFSYNQQPYHI